VGVVGAFIVASGEAVPSSENRAIFSARYEWFSVESLSVANAAGDVGTDDRRSPENKFTKYF
jgi:hypothetical protein